MANDFTNVIPQLLAQGIMALNGAVVMPRLVSNDLQGLAAQRGSVIDVPIAPEIAYRTVVPGATPVIAPAITPGKAQVQLTEWIEAPFYMTDSELMQVMNGTIPLCVSSAIAALAKGANAYIFSKYKKVYGYVGTAGTTPFSGATPSASIATQARKILGIQEAPIDMRRLVLDPEAAASALDLGTFRDVSQSGDQSPIIKGILGEKYGFGIYEDQQVPTHTAGTITGTLVAKAATAQAVGTTSVVCTSDDDIDLLEGDILAIAGQDLTYVVTADAARTGAGDITVVVSPGLRVALAGSEAITVKDDHVVNLGFTPGAFAFASRPLSDIGRELGVVMFSESITDPVSGISLRLEITRQHKQTQFSYDILFGAECIDPRKAVRMAG